MELSARDWIELVGVVVLPVVGFIFSLLLSGIRTEIKAMKEANAALEARVVDHQKEASRLYAELPDKYARRDELEKNFQQLRDMITRMDDKIERLLHKNLPEV